MNQLTQVQEYLKQTKLDAFVVMTKVSRQYLSGFTGSSGVLLITPNKSALFVDSRYTLRARNESSLTIKRISEFVSYAKNNNFKVIAAEDNISLAQYAQVKKLLPRTRWKITSEVVEHLRAKKNKTELRAIAKGSKIIDQTFFSVKKFLTKNKNCREDELAYMIEKTGKNLGAQQNAFDPIVAFGANASSPHHSPGKTKITTNNFLLLDFGFVVDGMHTDFTRTLILGKIHSKRLDIYQHVLDAQLKAINAIKLGVKARDVDVKARNHLQSQGLAKYFTHNCGHGVGLEIHELPNFSPKSADVLDTNMVVTVEPGVYLPDKFGIRIEDMVLVSNPSKVYSKVGKTINEMKIH